MTAAQEMPAASPELQVDPDVLARMTAVLTHEHGRFLGTSAAEVHAAHRLLSDFDYAGGMAAHLATIEYGSGPDNAAAVRAEYIDYANKAWNDRHHLHAFDEELAEYRDSSHVLRLGEIGLRPLGAVDVVIDGGAQLIRYRDLSRIQAGRRTGVYPFMPVPSDNRAATDPYTTDPLREMRLYVGSQLGLLRLGEAQRLLAAASTDQTNRFSFWASRLSTPNNLSRMAILAARTEKGNA